MDEEDFTQMSDIELQDDELFVDEDEYASSAEDESDLEDAFFTFDEHVSVHSLNEKGIIEWPGMTKGLHVDKNTLQALPVSAQALDVASLKLLLVLETLIRSKKRDINWIYGYLLLDIHVFFDTLTPFMLKTTVAPTFAILLESGSNLVYIIALDKKVPKGSWRVYVLVLKK